MPQSQNHILWPVDAFADDKTLQKNVIQLLKWLAKQPGTQIEPVYVMSPDQLRVSSTFFPARVGQFRLKAEHHLSEFLKKIKIPGLLPATILVSSDMSLHSAVGALMKYGHEKGSRLIVTSTLARKGVSRFLLGSFAETLLLRSSIPMLVVNPSAKPLAQIKHILFPTDFSQGSAQVFETVVAVAKQWNAKLTLFHQLEYLTQYSAFAFESAAMYHAYFEEDARSKQAEAERWAKKAQSAGVNTKAVLHKKAQFAPEAILAFVKKCPPGTVIAMGSQVGVVASAFVGSITRQVVRLAPCPVWVVHKAK